MAKHDGKSRRMWRRQVHLLERLLLADTFPPKESYASSLWAEWENRIQKGHEAEEQRLSELAARWKPPEGAEDWPFDAGDWLIDNHVQMMQLTTSMYAALVVSLWANMEHLLKQVIASCQWLLGLHSSKPSSIGQITNFTRQHLAVDLASCAEHSTVDAIRILNNSFKHTDGRYVPQAGQPHTRIASALLYRWRVIGSDGTIDYARLPVEELAIACHSFGSDFFASLEHSLHRRLG